MNYDDNTKHIDLKVHLLKHAIGAPEYQSEGSSCIDLQAAIATRHKDLMTSMFIKSGHRCIIPTGLVIEIPKGYEGQVRPRSGLAINCGITVLNSPGTIDSDYRGEIRVILINLGDVPYEINRGDRIAQLTITPVVKIMIREVSNIVSLSSTKRASGGFGSTGK